MRVLVTDGDYHNALAAVRNLGNRGAEVVCVSHSRSAQSFRSKHCMAHRLVPPSQDSKEYLEALVGAVKEYRIDVILPIGYESNVVVSKHRDEFEPIVKSAVAPWNKMSIAADKAKTLEFATHLGIGIPAQYRRVDDVDRFPAVVKGTLGSGDLRYVHSKAELERAARSDTVIQEYIPGTGYGYFALLNNGSVRAEFMHRRIREYPSTGGASTAAESVRDEHLRELGETLLTNLQWHGVAMVEFKKDARDGEFKLMEINPKFWGSLDLSIFSGIEFPYLTAKMAMDGDVAPVTSYRSGARFHWPLPYEVLNVLSSRSSLVPVIRDSLDRSVGSNVKRSDIGPTCSQIGYTVVKALKDMTGGKGRRAGA